MSEIVICDKCHFSHDVNKSHVCRKKNLESAAAARQASLTPWQMPKDTVDFHLKSIAGRILTLIDGVVPEGKQNAAIKTLVKKEFREQFHRVSEYFWSDGRNASVGVFPEVSKYEEEFDKF